MGGGQVGQRRSGSGDGDHGCARLSAKAWAMPRPSPRLAPTTSVVVPERSPRVLPVVRLSLSRVVRDFQLLSADCPGAAAAINSAPSLRRDGHGYECRAPRSSARTPQLRSVPGGAGRRPRSRGGDTDHDERGAEAVQSRSRDEHGRHGGHAGGAADLAHRLDEARRQPDATRRRPTAPRSAPTARTARSPPRRAGTRGADR